MSRLLPLYVLAASLTAVGCFSDVESVEPTGTTESSGGAEGTTASGTGETTAGGTEDESKTATSASDSDFGDTTSGTETGSGTTVGADSGSDSSSSSGEPVPMVCPTFFDTFDDEVEDSLWRQSFPGSTSEVGDELVISVTGDLNDQYVTMVVLPEEGGLEWASMLIELGTTPADIGVRTTLWVQPTEGDGRISYNLAQRDGGPRLEARITPEVGSPQIMDTLDWDSGTMGWLQLREEGGQLYFETSSDGVTFEVFYEMPTPFDVSSAEVGFAGHNDLALPSDVEVSVRSFEFICG